MWITSVVVNVTDFHSVFASSPWFASLPEHLQQILLSNARLKPLKSGQQLHAKGEEGVGFYGVCKGRIRVVNYCSQGRELLLALLSAGTWFGEISLFDEQPRTHDSYSEGDATIAFVPKASFTKMLETHPAFYPHFTRLLCTRVRSAFQFIDAQTGMSLDNQLRKRLFMLVSSYGQPWQEQNAVTLTLSQESLGQMINASRQTVNQLLKAMEGAGEITLGYGKVTIIEPDAFFRQVR